MENMSLQSLIELVQIGDSNAMLELCNRFRPLIFKEAHKSLFELSLGREDAESIAVLEFITFVQNYKGDDFEHVPGLMKVCIYNALVDQVRKTHGGHQNEIDVDFTDDFFDNFFNGGSLAESPEAELVSQELSVELKKAISSLSSKEKLVIFHYFFFDYKEKDIAEKLHCSDRYVRKIKKAALLKLRNILQYLK